MEILLIIISAIFVNNIVLAQFLGICPFLGVSNKLSTATGMSAAVCFVITLSTLVTYLLNNYVLVPLGLEFLQTISFILVIAALVQMVEIVLKKVSPALYQHSVFSCRSSPRTVLCSAWPLPWLPRNLPSGCRHICSAWVRLCSMLSPHQ